MSHSLSACELGRQVSPVETAELTEMLIGMDSCGPYEQCIR